MAELASGMSNKNGVYQIRNILNNKLYVGSTAEKRGFIYRWQRHRRDLRSNHHHCIHLQRAWNKYKEDVFIFEILLYCDSEDCLTFEQIALDEIKPLYNTCRNARNCFGMIHSDKTKEKIRASKIGRLNPMYGKKGEQCHNSKLTKQNVEDIRDWLQYWPMISQCSIARMYNVSDNHISLIRRKLIW